MLFALCAVWGGTFPATKLAVSITNPLHFLTLRFLIASLLILLAALVYPPLRNLFVSTYKTVGISLYRYGILIGVLLFLGFLLQTVGMKYTTASRSGFFTGLLVIIVPLLALLFRSSQMPLLATMGVIPALAGIYLLADPKLGGLNLGDTLTIACAVVFALQMVVLEIAMRKVKDVLAITAVQIFTVAILGLIISLIIGLPFQISATGWFAAIYTSLLGTLLAIWMQTRYQPEVPAGYAGLIFSAEPIFAGVFAWLILEDTWSSKGLIGAGLILLGMIVSSLIVLPDRTKKHPPVI
ncbi:DMT family transporter [Calditrichota bacterium]